MIIAAEQVEVAADRPQSGAAWTAIIGGALAAAAVSLALMVLGSGLGLSIVSPWASPGDTAAALAVGGLIWLIIVQWVAAALGGYLTGRLRNRIQEPGDEIFFRDTANGFLAWALSTLLVAGLLTSALSSIVGAGARVTATVASGAVAGAGAATRGALDPTAYFVDTLYRAAPSAAGAAPGIVPSAATAPPVATGPSGEVAANLRAETGRILANGIASAEFSRADRDYLVILVAQEAELTAKDAAARVDGVIESMQAARSEAQAAADAARKAAATASLFIFLSLLIGAFIAAVAAALGGAHRDDPETILPR